MHEAPTKATENCVRRHTGDNQCDRCTDCEHYVLDTSKAERNGRETWRPKRIAEDDHKRCIHSKRNDLWQSSSEQSAHSLRQAIIGEDSDTGRATDSRHEREAEPPTADKDFRL